MNDKYKLQDRLTSKRVNGIKTGYWSPATKEELVQRLAAYENCELTPEGFQHYIDACERNVGHYLAESVKYEKRCKKTEAAVPKWISVKDRLPDKWLWVLISDGNGADADVAYINDNEDWIEAAFEPTHWMPLPPPPKMEDRHE